jgi:hypothetical protein
MIIMKIELIGLLMMMELEKEQLLDNRNKKNKSKEFILIFEKIDSLLQLFLNLIF